MEDTPILYCVPGTMRSWVSRKAGMAFHFKSSHATPLLRILDERGSSLSNRPSYVLQFSSRLISETRMWTDVTISETSKRPIAKERFRINSVVNVTPNIRIQVEDRV